MSVLSTIQRQAFTADVKLPPPPGEAIFVGSGGATQSFVVPSGVYSISVVAVSLNPTTACRLLRGAAVLLDTTAAVGVGNDGGGNGGAKGTNNTGLGSYDSYNAGGGAGGYAGNGGGGGLGRYDGVGQAGGSGNGGGGGGGGGGSGNGSSMVSQGGLGAGVGLFGQASNGAGGTAAAQGANGSPLGAPYVGGGSRNAQGGNLRYRNNIAVTPGETLTVSLGSTLATNNQGPGMRVIWGANRAFPSTNCGPTVPQGQAYVAKQNTTWIVPEGVTSISLAAQQLNGDAAAVSVVAAGVTVLRAENGNRIGTGGGDGGLPGSLGSPEAGGGGAGGYGGNGGNGGMYTPQPNGSWTLGAGTNGAGSAAGGGASGSRQNQGAWGGGTSNYSYTPTGYGGSVGIEGAGPDGLGGSSGASPNGGHGGLGPVNGPMGGGAPGQRGGALSWLGALAVTPGQVLTINAAGGRVRVVWGPGRSYPNNAGNI